MQGAHRAIAIGPLHRILRDRRFGGADALVCVDGYLLLHTPDRFAPLGQLRGLFLQVQHQAGFLDNLRVRRLLPRMVPPGLDSILTQLASDGTGRNRGHDPLLDRHHGQFLPTPPPPDLHRRHAATNGLGHAVVLPIRLLVDQQPDAARCTSPKGAV